MKHEALFSKTKRLLEQHGSTFSNPYYRGAMGTYKRNLERAEKYGHEDMGCYLSRLYVHRQARVYELEEQIRTQETVIAQEARKVIDHRHEIAKLKAHVEILQDTLNKR